ncbi:unnamed protein product [Cladocopium goreaui]|uniref:Uncharacterized protein n=1 Tax=Cladocopium goreaui TaxID=2562237 RepID=A0A9P1G9X5_9DINO|nr:unnamed protein product [Cladocopium goreaui]
MATPKDPKPVPSSSKADRPAVKRLPRPKKPVKDEAKDRPAPKKMPRNAKEEPPEASIFDVKSESGDSNISEMLEHENGSAPAPGVSLSPRTVAQDVHVDMISQTLQRPFQAPSHLFRCTGRRFVSKYPNIPLVYLSERTVVSGRIHEFWGRIVSSEYFPTTCPHKSRF